jgi:hypothetical protein
LQNETVTSALDVMTLTEEMIGEHADQIFRQFSNNNVSRAHHGTIEINRNTVNTFKFKGRSFVTDQRYPHGFSPGNIGSLKLSNRLVVPAMATMIQMLMELHPND